MQVFLLGLFFFIIFSCTTSTKSRFAMNEFCSAQGLKHLKNPRFSERKIVRSSEAEALFTRTSIDIQKCYEQLVERRGELDFGTCLVMGFNEIGKRDVFHFSSGHPEINHAFYSCAKRVVDAIANLNHGENVMLFQSYRFYISDK